MATESVVKSVGTLTASAAITTPNRFVKVSGNRTIALASAATDNVIGVVRNKPAIGEPADVAIDGEVIMEAGAAVVAGVDLMSDASGRAITGVAAAGANRLLGTALEGAAAAGVLFSVLLPGVRKAL